MSYTTIKNIFAKIRDGYFGLRVNQRLYINAVAMLILYLVSLRIFGFQETLGLLLIFFAYWIAAICYDLTLLYEKVYKFSLGKAFLVILLSLCTNFAIVLSSQLVNNITGIDPSKFPHTIALLSILSIPVFIAAGFIALYFVLTLGSPLLIVFYGLYDNKGKEILIPGYPNSPSVPCQGITRTIQFVSIALFCSVVFSLSGNEIVTRSYIKFNLDTARSFLYNLEMYPKTLCGIEKDSRVAFLSEEKILVGKKSPTGIVFKVRACIKLNLNYIVKNALINSIATHLIALNPIPCHHG
jgi:hypothetical protein